MIKFKVTVGVYNGQTLMQTFVECFEYELDEAIVQRAMLKLRPISTDHNLDKLMITKRELIKSK